MVLLQIRVRIVSLLRHHIEMKHRHDDHFVRQRNDLKGITSLMNHQVQHVMDDCACNAQDDWNRFNKQTLRANDDTHQHAPSKRSHFLKMFPRTRSCLHKQFKLAFCQRIVTTSLSLSSICPFSRSHHPLCAFVQRCNTRRHQ